MIMECCTHQPNCSHSENCKISQGSVCSVQLETDCECDEKDERSLNALTTIDCECDEKDERPLNALTAIEPERNCHEENERSLSKTELECDCNEKKDSTSCRSLSPFSKIASSASLSSIASFPEYNLKPNIPIEEIKRRLIELLEHSGSDLVQACRNFDRRATRKIHKTYFRQILRTFCFSITAAQFDILLKELNFHHSGKINYMDFFSNLMGGKSIHYEKSSERLDNLPIDEVELRIKEKIKPILRDVIRSFWLFDINKDGFIQKSEFRRIIKNYCFDLSENLFDELWKVHDSKNKGIISYKDFLIKLGVDADRYKTFMPPETVARALCWSDGKSKKLTQDINFEQRIRRAALENKDDPAIMGLPLEKVVAEFMNRLYLKSKILKKIFNVFDYEKNGEIALSDFCGVINFFLMPLSPPLFHRVMKRLDVYDSSDSKINYNCFLGKFSQSGKRGFKDIKLDCLPIVQHIKNHVLNPEERLRSILTSKISELKEQITRKELKRAIEKGLKLNLSDEEFKDLLEVLDPGNTNLIQCKSFLQMFECPREECDKKESCSVICSPKEEKYQCLRGDKLKSKFKHHLNKVFKDVEKAIFIYDSNQSGFITSEKLKHILTGLCIPLSCEQFQEIISGFKVYGDSLNYREFLNCYSKKASEDIEKWIARVNKLVTYKSRCPPDLPLDEVEEMLRECVQSRKSGMLKDFKTLDMCNVGVICKDDARNVLNKFSFRFNDQQFCELWKKFPRNKFDQLLYDKFLENYFTLENQHKTDVSEPKDKLIVDFIKPGCMHATSKQNLKEKKETIHRKSAKDMLLSRAPHLKKIIESMEPVIIRNIRTIRYHLHKADSKLSGIVDFYVLNEILEKSGIRFSPEEQFYILEYFDTKLSGKINYKEFLQIFVWYA